MKYGGPITVVKILACWTWQKQLSLSITLSILPQRWKTSIVLKVLQSFFDLVRGPIKEILGISQVGFSQGKHGVIQITWPLC